MIISLNLEEDSIGPFFGSSSLVVFVISMAYGVHLFKTYSSEYLAIPKNACPSCGKKHWLTPTTKCDWCGRVACSNCLPKAEWIGWFEVKTKKETGRESAQYVRVGFCSESCSTSFWDSVKDYSIDAMEKNVKVDEIDKVSLQLFEQAILDAFKKNPNIERQKYSIDLIEKAINLQTLKCAPVIVRMRMPNSGKSVNIAFINALEFKARCCLELEYSLDRQGRFDDAEQIYEIYFNLYSQAQGLRGIGNQMRYVV